ncbi:tetraspanin-8-like [Pyrus x bretschneideri]|uniref:tetraspanin-8-like n=1 Tax=Pyrus x bretschneideri TaxID=225117 RepID=UPI000510AFBB|nr:tetraspanin-8-like [Pyrus x bretschneideri]
MNLANNLLGLLNILTFLISVPIVIVGVQLYRVNAAGQCLEVFRLPVLVLGVLIMVMSIVGIISACCRISCLLWIYLLVMLLLLIGLMSIYAISFFIIWKSGGGTRVPGTELKEYKLSGYAEWLQNTVQGKGWDSLKNCLVVSQACNYMPKNDTKIQEFNMKELPPIMAGCCKPLAECGFSYKSPTVWIRNNSTSSSPDCKAWNNDPKVLCYNCDSCKAGTLEQLLDTWKRMHFLKIVFLGFLVLVYSIGCCAFKNTRKKPDYWRQ